MLMLRDAAHNPPLLALNSKRKGDPRFSTRLRTRDWGYLDISNGFHVSGRKQSIQPLAMKLKLLCIRRSPLDWPFFLFTE